MSKYFVKHSSVYLKEWHRVGYHIVKRSFDLLFSVGALAFFLPLFSLVALAIALEDGMPVIYAQERIGQHKKPFRIYKFRSMRHNAEKIHETLREACGNTEVSFKLKNDPRVTKVGKIIRATNIDELPQLINIIKGEMSLVGPRPLPVYEFEEEQARYGDTYSERYTVPQGLTCFWQIADRASLPFSRRMEMDVEYARVRGIKTDFVLISKTLFFTIIGKTAY